MNKRGIRRPVTITQLARQLGLHHTTVSMALRGSPRIAEATRRSVQELAARLHYTPNTVARAMRYRSTRTLGVVFPLASLPHYAALLDAIAQEAVRRGLSLDVHFHQWQSERELEALRKLIERRVDAIILAATEQEPWSGLRKVFHPGLGIPLGMAHSPVRSNVLPDFARALVGTDMQAGSEALGDYLLGLGHRRLVLLYQTWRIPGAPLTAREKGLRSAVSRCPGAALKIVDMGAPPRTPDGEWEVQKRGTNLEEFMAYSGRLVERMLALRPAPTAVIASNETLALVLLSALRRAGVRVPEEMSVATYDGTYVSAYGAIPLTCVQQPVHDIAATMIEQLLTPVPATAAPPAPRSLPATLIVRDSTAVAPGVRLPGAAPMSLPPPGAAMMETEQGMTGRRSQ